jgi:hypothetical protein
MPGRRWDTCDPAVTLSIRSRYVQAPDPVLDGAGLASRHATMRALVCLGLVLWSGVAAAQPSCWKPGTPIAGDDTVNVPPVKLARGYPALIPAVDPAERTRREATLAIRNRDMVFTLDELGGVTSVVSRALPCSTQTRGVTKGIHVVSDDENAFAAAVMTRNRGAFGGGDVSVTSVTDRNGQVEITMAPQLPAYHSAARSFAPAKLGTAKLLAAFQRVAKIQRVRIVAGDSCGPGCGPPPVAETILGTQPIRARDVQILSLTVFYKTPNGMLVRKVAMLQLNLPDARLSPAQVTIDAVTGARVVEEAYDLFE